VLDGELLAATVQVQDWWIQPPLARGLGGDLALISAFRFASGHVSRTVRRSFLSVPPTKVDYEYEDDGNTALLLQQPVRLPISPLALTGY
jgi:hypothetical protein